jgi:hypothetical protein
MCVLLLVGSGSGNEGRYISVLENTGEDKEKSGEIKNK